MFLSLQTHVPTSTFRLHTGRSNGDSCENWRTSGAIPFYYNIWATTTVQSLWTLFGISYLL